MPEYALREGRGRFSLRRFPGGWSVAFTLPLFFFFVLPFLRLFWLSVWSDGGPILGLYADLVASERVHAGICISPLKYPYLFLEHTDGKIDVPRVNISGLFAQRDLMPFI